MKEFVTSTHAAGDIIYATADLQLVMTTIISLPASKADRLPGLQESMNNDVALMGTSAQTLYVALASYPEALAKVEELGALIATSGDQRQEVLALRESGDASGAYMLYDSGYSKTLAQIQTMATELRAMVETLTANDYASSLQTNTSMTVLLLGLTLVAVLLGVMQSAAFREEISCFSGNDYRDLGKIIMEV